MTTLRLGDTAPDFEADTTEGHIEFHNWKSGKWAVLFSHPADFTPVCTTELGRVAALKDEFASRNTKVIGISVDSLEHHEGWKGDIADVTGHALNFPLIADPDRKVAELYEMLPEGTEDPADAESTTVRALFIIGPDKRIKASFTYPESTGRNFDEVLRLLDSCQLTYRYQVATPANWHHGEDVIILPELADEEAEKYFPDGWRAPLPYVRLVPDPSFGDDWFSTLERH